MNGKERFISHKCIDGVSTLSNMLEWILSLGTLDCDECNSLIEEITYVMELFSEIHCSVNPEFKAICKSVEAYENDGDYYGKDEPNL